MEKSTGFESIVTIARAEDILVRKMPELGDAFGPLSAKEWRFEEEEEERWYLAGCCLRRTEHDDDDNAPSRRPPPSVPDLARPIALPQEAVAATVLAPHSGHRHESLPGVTTARQGEA